MPSLVVRGVETGGGALFGEMGGREPRPVTSAEMMRLVSCK